MLETMGSTSTGHDANWKMCRLDVARLPKRNRKQVVEDGRVKKKSFYDHAMTEEKVEQELDQIFKDLKYAPEEYPYESGWREDGCTTKMVLQFCRMHDIICHVYHNTVKNGNELESYTPSGACLLYTSPSPRD